METATGLRGAMREAVLPEGCQWFEDAPGETLFPVYGPDSAMPLAERRAYIIKKPENPADPRWLGYGLSFNENELASGSFAELLEEKIPTSLEYFSQFNADGGLLPEPK